MITLIEWTKVALITLVLLLPVSPVSGQPESGSDTEKDQQAASVNSDTEEWEDDIDIPDDFESRFVWSGDNYRVHFWGNLRNLTAYNNLNEESLLNPDNINNFADWRNRTEARLKLDSAITDYFQFFIRQRLTYEVREVNDDIRTDFNHPTDQLYGTAEFNVDPLLTFLSFGKQRIKWGTAFAWNPVDTFNPRQDLRDTQRTEEGRVSYRADLAIPALTFTGVLVPNIESKELYLSNWIFKDNKSLAAGRLYTFLWNTDLAGYLSYEEDEDPRYGVSFSTVIDDLQIFGEGVYWNGESEKQYIIEGTEVITITDPDSGAEFEIPIPYDVTRKTGGFYKFVLGLQYTFFSDITVIAEYYHNSNGFTKEDMDNYIDFLKYAGGDYGDDLALYESLQEAFPDLDFPELPSQTSLIRDGAGLYRFADLRQNYFHFSAGYPFVGARFDLGFDSIVSLDEFIDYGDLSMFMRLSASYVGIRNWRFTLYSQHYLGAPETEFGMYPIDWSAFFQVRYFF